MNAPGPCAASISAGLRGPVLEVVGVCMSFAGVRVLNDVSLQVSAGELHALVGENGAGKSTLMKVLAGLHAPDSGEVRVDGSAVQPGNPHLARRAGIAMIHQELLPFLDLSIAENIFMGQEPVSKFPGWIDRAAMERESRALLGRLGVEVSPRRKMRELRVAEMQSVEIAKALAHRARLIIMDEPTSALSEREAEALFRIVRELLGQGTAVIYISHKLDEVFGLAERVTVLRDGTVVGTHAVTELNRDKLISLMVGRAPFETGREPGAQAGEVALSVRDLSKARRFKNVSFEVRSGEVLGLAGLMGAGRTDVVNAIYGLDPADSGGIFVSGKPVRIRNTSDAIRAGIGLVTEDRGLFGIVPRLGVKANLTLAALSRWCRKGFIDNAAEAVAAEEQIAAFAIRTGGRNQPVERLSGGNQQKVVLARTLLTEPDLLLLDEPTRGIDIAAKAEVHALIRRLARAGKAVVLVSSEMPELLSLSDRILVLRQGEIAAELETRRTTAGQILSFAMPQ